MESTKTFFSSSGSRHSNPIQPGTGLSETFKKDTPLITVSDSEPAVDTEGFQWLPNQLSKSISSASDPQTTATTGRAGSQYAKPVRSTRKLDDLISNHRKKPQPDENTTPHEAETIAEKLDCKNKMPAEGLQAFLDNFNAYRQEHGLKPVKLNLELCQAAQKHSNYQAKKSSCTHYGPKTHNDPYIHDNDPHWFTGRAQLAGYKGKPVNENVAAGQSNDPHEAIGDWDQSPGHKRTMLAKNIDEIGIGYTPGGNGQYKGRWTLMTGHSQIDLA